MNRQRDKNPGTKKKDDAAGRTGVTRLAAAVLFATWAILMGSAAPAQKSQSPPNTNANASGAGRLSLADNRPSRSTPARAECQSFRSGRR